MAVLVTGATGLVGSRLLPRLVDSGIDCRALVREGKETPPGVERVEGDILDSSSLEPAVEGVSAIVHLAAVLRTPDPEEIRKVNLDGTRNLIAAARVRAPEARFILASTGLVYGDDLGHPALESDPATAELPYPASKIAAENELRRSGLNWSILRIAFVYGDEDGHLRSAPKLLAKWGWQPSRALSLVHHRDIATAVELALDGAANERVVNITDEAPTTILEIAHIVGADYGVPAGPDPTPWKGRLDGTLARSLGFVPTVPTVYQAAREGIL